MHHALLGATMAGLFALMPSVVFAQALSYGLGNSGAPFSMTLAPTYPAPDSTATLSFVSASGLDLSNATLAVSVDGTSVYAGSVQTISIPIGAAGALTNIKAVVTSNGASYTQSLAVHAQDVSLVAEPVSSAPPLYPGKPLVPTEGDVRVVAIANIRTSKGVQINPAELSYAWTVDGVQMANFSGIGKDSIMVASPLQYRSRTVSVTVQSQDGTLVGGASIDLQTSEPKILVYVADPLLGILFNHALSGTYALSGTESTLYAAPYSLASNVSGASLQWFVNGTAAQTGQLLTVRPTGQGAGSANISVTGTIGTYTTAATDFSVAFGTTTSSFFGL